MTVFCSYSKKNTYTNDPILINVLCVVSPMQVQRGTAELGPRHCGEKQELRLEVDNYPMSTIG